MNLHAMLLYFQKIKAAAVLVDLIYMICHMYIGDCSIFGDSNIKFVSQLRSAFERFRNTIYTLKPINVTSLSKSFSPLIELFERSELLARLCRNHSTVVKPLQDLIASYYKTRRIVWTSETTAAFHEIKLVINKCSTLHFMSWLFCGWIFYFRQLMALTNLLLLSVNHLTTTSFFQKEALGIFYSCMYLQSLLRGRLIKIWTDHRNSLFIKNYRTVIHGIEQIWLYTRVHSWCSKQYHRR